MRHVDALKSKSSLSYLSCAKPIRQYNDNAHQDSNVEIKLIKTTNEFTTNEHFITKSE